MSDPLNDFIEELREAGHSTTGKSMVPFFHRLKYGSDPLTIDMYDHIVAILRRRTPLSERLTAIIKPMEDWLRKDAAAC